MNNKSARFYKRLSSPSQARAKEASCDRLCYNNPKEAVMKALTKHGVGILTKRVNDKLFIELVPTGTLIHSDYQLFIPIIEKALKESVKQKLYNPH